MATASGSDAATKKLKVCVLGAGSFGTAMAFVAATTAHNHDVLLVARSADAAAEINSSRENAKYLKGFKLPDNLTATADVAAALAGSDLVIHAIPVQASSAYLSEIAPLIPPTAPLVSTSKGIDVKTMQLMPGLIAAALRRPHPTAYVSGPSFAKELMQQRMTNVSLAAEDPAVAKFVQSALSSRCFRVYTHGDVVGLELAGACKNVVALIAGYIAGADLGANCHAGVITRAFTEVCRLGVRMGARVETFLGLAGMGDLMLTCTSPQSRNYTVGYRMGKGEAIEAILASMTQVAEGVASAEPIRRLVQSVGLADHLPILISVADVVGGRIKPLEAIGTLLSRSLKDEFTFTIADSAPPAACSHPAVAAPAAAAAAAAVAEPAEGAAEAAKE